jgi:hypothetical protein
MSEYCSFSETKAFLAQSASELWSENSCGFFSKFGNGNISAATSQAPEHLRTPHTQHRHTAHSTSTQHTSSIELQTPDSRLQTPDSRLQTPLFHTIIDWMRQPSRVEKAIKTFYSDQKHAYRSGCAPLVPSSEAFVVAVRRQSDIVSDDFLAVRALASSPKDPHLVLKFRLASSIASTNVLLPLFLLFDVSQAVRLIRLPQLHHATRLPAPEQPTAGELFGESKPLHLRRLFLKNSARDEPQASCTCRPAPTATQLCHLRRGHQQGRRELSLHSDCES